MCAAAAAQVQYQESSLISGWIISARGSVSRYQLDPSSQHKFSSSRRSRIGIAASERTKFGEEFLLHSFWLLLPRTLLTLLSRKAQQQVLLLLMPKRSSRERGHFSLIAISSLQPRPLLPAGKCTGSHTTTGSQPTR